MRPTFALSSLYRIITVIAGLTLAASCQAQQVRFTPTDSIGFEPWCITNINAITYEAVLRLDVPQAEAGGMIYTEHRAGSYDRQLAITGDGVSEYSHPIDGGSSWQVPVAISTGEWHHLAFCYDGQQERFYLDGVLIASRQRSGALAAPCGPGFPGDGVGALGRVVRTDGAVRESFVGSLESFRLSQFAKYTGDSFTPPVGDLSAEDDTLLLYNFSECRGSVAVDDGPLHRDGLFGAQGGASPERTGSACPADFNCDGTSNSTDVSDFINQWFQDQADGAFVTDWDHNGVVNSTDVSAFINDWFADAAGKCG